MTKNKIKNVILVVFIVLLTNTIFVHLGLSPFDIKYLFPKYTDRIWIVNASWADDDKVLFTKRIINRKESGRNMFFRGNDVLSDKTYLCIMNFDGSGKKEILELPARCYPSDIISSNNKIVFLDQTTNELMFVNKDGSGYKTLIEGRSGSFSPDGEKIVLGTESGIGIVDLESKNVVKLTDFGDCPIWSKDGSKIIFRKFLDSYTCTSEFWLINLKDKVPVKLNLGSNFYRLIDFMDDNNIVFEDSRKTGHIGGDYDGYIFNINSGNLSKAPVIGKYSRDGKYILTQEVKVYDLSGKVIMGYSTKDISYGRKNRMEQTNIW